MSDKWGSLTIEDSSFINTTSEKGSAVFLELTEILK